MSGKTYIGGTAYDQTAGKTMVGGTAYNITAGKTLVGGTAYDIKFGAKPSDILDLINDMTLVANSSVGNSPARDMSFSPTLSAGTYYLFSCCYGYMNIYKLTKTSSSLSGELLKNMTTSYGYCNFSNNNIRYFGSSTSSSVTQVYGGSLVVVNFPSYLNAIIEIDDILSNVTLTRVAGWNSSSYVDYMYTDNKNYTYYLTTTRNTMGGGTGYTGFDFWTPFSNTYTRIKKVNPDYDGAVVQTVYGQNCLVCSNQQHYGCSIISINDAS